MSGYTKKRTDISGKKKDTLLKIIIKNKEEYDCEIAATANKVNFNPRTGKHCEIKPKEGCISKSIREYFSDLRDKPYRHPEFDKARKFATRMYDDFVCFQSKCTNDGGEGGKKVTKYRKPGAGRKQKAPDVPLGVFDWFLDVHGILKGRLPRKLILTKCREMYGVWLKNQDPPVPEEEQLKFGGTWLHGWMQEFGMSLKKPNKRFAIPQNDRKERILEYLKNIWRVRYFFQKNFNTKPTIYNRDQMPLSKRISASKNFNFQKRGHLREGKLHAVKRGRQPTLKCGQNLLISFHLNSCVMKCFALQIQGTLRKARRNIKMRILNGKRRERESAQNAYRA